MQDLECDSAHSCFLERIVTKLMICLAALPVLFTNRQFQNYRPPIQPLARCKRDFASVA